MLLYALRSVLLTRILISKRGCLHPSARLSVISCFRTTKIVVFEGVMSGVMSDIVVASEASEVPPRYSLALGLSSFSLSYFLLSLGFSFPFFRSFPHFSPSLSILFPVPSSSWLIFFPFLSFLDVTTHLYERSWSSVRPQFLDATKHLYKRLCPSVGPSICPVLFSNDENRCF